MSSQTRVAVIGAGSWGTALALQLERNGHQVNLWGHEEAHILDLQNHHENKAYLPDIPLPLASIHYPLLPKR